MQLVDRGADFPVFGKIYVSNKGYYFYTLTKGDINYLILLGLAKVNKLASTGKLNEGTAEYTKLYEMALRNRDKLNMKRS